MNALYQLKENRIRPVTSTRTRFRYSSYQRKRDGTFFYLPITDSEAETEVGRCGPTSNPLGYYRRYHY